MFGPSFMETPATCTSCVAGHPSLMLTRADESPGPAAGEWNCGQGDSQLVALSRFGFRLFVALSG